MKSQPTYCKNDRNGCHPGQGKWSVVPVEVHVNLPWNGIMNVLIPEVLNQPEPNARNDHPRVKDIHEPRET